MAVDIYLRNTNDPTFEENRTEISEELDLFLQQIEMVLLTPKGSVIGLPDFGGSLETFLWQFNVSSQQLKAEVNRQIQTYCSYARKFPTQVDVQIYETEFRDSAVIDISINGLKILGLAIK